MVEKIDNDRTRKSCDEPCRVDEGLLRTLLGDRNVGFDAYQVVYAQESLWVLDLRFVANSPDALRGLRGHVQTVGRAYSKHGPGGRYLRLFAWGGIEEFIH